MLNRKMIWGIVMLMATALIGIMLIQSYWINWSVQLNKEKFDKAIYESLNNVADRLDRREKDRALELLEQENYPDELIDDRIFDSPETIEGETANVQNRDGRPYFNLSSRSLAERVDLEALDHYLEYELNNRGINLDYSYGVISNRHKNYIIMDGYYVFDEILPEVSNTGMNTGLDKSPYRVELFKDPNRLIAPGYLVIYFPKAGRKAWESVWQMLAGSFIFTILILICFTYTVLIIFRQKRVSEMKTDFINNMTHEFKTPIATISLATDSITNPNILNNPEKITRFTNIIKLENKRMLGQVEKVLQMAQLEKQQVEMNMGEVDIHELIKHASDHISLQVEKRGGAVTFHPEAQSSIIEGDYNHLSNVIHNLLDNANKYSKESPIIEIKTSNSIKGINISISDNGIGMTKEQQKYIFERFYRVHTGNVHDVKGFGLGLTYVKSIVESHYGSIEVKSEPGKGSTFMVFLPFKQSKRN